jgi:hypothetical protein
MEQDERASEPPADTEPEESPSTEGDPPREDPAEDPGPRGNPDVDEEALRHKQEEQDGVSGN